VSPILSHTLELGVPDSVSCARARSVRIWEISAENAPETSEEGWQILSVDEKERADRFHFAKDRLHFILFRSSLRKILGTCSGLAPEEIRFQYSLEGKPELIADQNSMGLRFNLAHSHGRMLVAVTCNRRIGVDLEYVRPLNHLARIITRVCTSQEQAHLEGISPENKLEVFFWIWARKEAWVKAIGKGLQLPLQTLDVLGTVPQRVDRTTWHLLDLPVVGTYQAAVAVEGEPDHPG
jgi:4'-phosphopantetheinyl transferase